MGDKTAIEWTEASWNPVRGCSRVSEGCRECYAERVAARFSGPGMPYEGLAEMTERGPRWTGKVRLVEEHLQDPIRWKRPRRIFVNSMSDLFHESLSNSDISRVFGVMYKAKHHIFQVLTKRPKRMLDFISRSAFLSNDPLENVWLGVSVEDQGSAYKRISTLIKTPAAIKWVSYEPALAPVNFKVNNHFQVQNGGFRPLIDDLNWIVVGGESGPGARPFNVQWARNTIIQCESAKVPVFVKQLGAWPFMSANFDGELLPLRLKRDGKKIGPFWNLTDPKGGDWSEWPIDLRVRQYPVNA